MHTLLEHKESIVDKVNDTIEYILESAGNDPLDSEEMDALCTCCAILKEIAKIKHMAHSMGSGRMKDQEQDSRVETNTRTSVRQPY